jgi:8-oxo-dGTP diphosphatase
MRLGKKVQAVPRALGVDRSGILRVLVGLVRDDEGRVLINQRRAGTHRAGEWEFPGGKQIEGEAPFDALCRELAEELGIRVLAAEPFIQLDHDYGDRCVRLDVWCVRRYRGEPVAREGQPLRWVRAEELDRVALLPADEPIVRALLDTP